MSGMNVKNHEVLGIPTLSPLDANGIVLKYSARVDEVIPELSRIGLQGKSPL